MRRFTLNIQTIRPPSPEPIEEPEPEPVAPEPMAVDSPVVEEQPKSRLSSRTLFLADTLGFLPTNFIDDVINAMNSLIYEALGEVEKFLQTNLSDSPEVIIQVLIIPGFTYVLSSFRLSMSLRHCTKAPSTSISTSLRCLHSATSFRSPQTCA
jgi:hypothetical protein